MIMSGYGRRLCSLRRIFYCFAVFSILLDFVNSVDSDDEELREDRRKNAILPYSLYQRRLEEERRLNSLQPETRLDSNSIVQIYLPPFKEADSSQIADSNGDTVQRKEISQRKETTERPTYSTGDTRQPLPYHKSIFRPRANQIIATKEQRFRPQPSIGQSPKAASEKLLRPIAEEEPPLIDPPAFLGSVQRPSVPSNSVISPVYSQILPAPFNSLSSNASPDNIVQNIFAQSQNPNLRMAPSHFPASAIPSAVPSSSVPMNPLNGLLNPNALNGGSGEFLNPLQLLNGGGNGFPLEMISKMARNLISLSSSNPDILNSLTKALTNGGAAAEGAKLTSSVVEKTPALFSSVKDEDRTNSSSFKILSSLPEEQRTLLAAAIENGEIDGANLTLGETSKTPVLKADNKLMEWIQQNRPRAADREQSPLSAEHLPYYGRYCGSFVEKANSSKHFNITGALWAVDERRLIISKFHFKPGSRTENITFWGGPKVETGTASDVFPNENGFYLKPEPIDLSAFVIQKAETITAKIRNRPLNDSTSNRTAELEELEDEEVITENEIKRTRRDTTIHLNTNSSGLQLTVPTETPINSSATEVIVGEKKAEWSPLDWYAGFQPLLLTLPSGYSVRTLHWLSIFDHDHNESAAGVLIPNGIAFQIPVVVELKPLSPNGAYKISSGPIRILDTKTVVISDFSLQTNGVPVWFLIGKDVLPNSGGQIVPLFDLQSRSFDCDSLRDFKNETVTLRLPATTDIYNVFWFSVFSLTQSVSLAHIYVPYNDVHLPPDLTGIATPRCQFLPK